MTIAILAWQALIFFTIALGGRARGWLIAFWVIWTLIQVATFPLSVIQFFTIFLATLISSGAKPNANAKSRALSADREKEINEEVERALSKMNDLESRRPDNHHDPK